MPTRTTISGPQIRDGGITDADVASANKDGASGTPCMRTLSTTSGTACAGNDARLSDARTPSMSAAYYGGLAGVINATLAASVASNALTIALKTYAATDPSATDISRFLFRNATIATGTWVEQTATAALSLVVSSGSTLGIITSGVAFRLWVVIFDDGGTLRLGVINCNNISGNVNDGNIYKLRDDALASSTAEGGAGAADSAYVIYTGTAVTTKAYRILGYLDYGSGLATAGTWASAPTKIQLFGPGVSLPGEILQTVLHFRNDYAGTTTTIPNDDTIPQSSEGTEFFTKAITPISAANILEMEVQASYGSTTGGHLYYGFFQDSTASAIAAGWTAANVFHSGIASYRMLAGTTSSTTIKFRMGPNSTNGGTGSINGFSGSRYLGGSASSFLVVREIMG